MKLLNNLKRQQRTNESISNIVVVRFGNAHEFLSKFNPDRQVEVAKNPDAVFLGSKSPTLGMAADAYGYDIAVNLIELQLSRAVCAFPESKRVSVEELHRISCDILNSGNFKHIKVTEFMLFVSMLRSGELGEVYGALNTFSICAALRKFLQRKEERLALLQRQAERMERKKEYERREKESITWEEFCKRTGTPIDALKIAKS